MAFNQYRGNATNPGGAGGGPGTYVQSALVGARASGAGGGRISGWHIGSVNATPSVQPPGNPGGIVFTGTNTPIGNPNFPCAAGPEIEPLGNSAVSIDTGTAYYFKHIPTAAAENLTMWCASQFQPATALQQHAVAFDYYRGNITPDSLDNSQVYQEPQQFVLPLFASTAFNASSPATWDPVTQTIVANGQFAAVSRLGGTCLRMDGSNPSQNYIDLTFDPTQLTPYLYNLASGYSGGRITKLSLRYRAWRDNAADPAPGEGFLVSYNDTTAPAIQLIGGWLQTNYQSTAQLQEKNVGETNYMARGRFQDRLTPYFFTWTAHPFTIEDLFLGGSFGAMFFRFAPQQGAGANQRYLYLDYAELLVEVVQERREGTGIRIVSNLFDNPPGGIHYDSGANRIVDMRYPGSSKFTVNLPIQSYNNLCVREAVPADPSDLFSVQQLFTPNNSLTEAIGPSLQIPAITQYRQTQYPQLQTFTGNIVNQQLKAELFQPDPAQNVLYSKLTPFENYNISVGAFCFDATNMQPSNYATSEGFLPTGTVLGTLWTTGAFWAGYRAMANLDRLEVNGAAGAFPVTESQRIWVKGGVTYSYIHAVVKTSPSTTDDIQFQLYDNSSVLLQFVNIAAATVNARPDIGNGWRSVEFSLFTPFTPTSDGYYYLQAASVASPDSSWYLAAAASLGDPIYNPFNDHPNPSFGYDPIADSIQTTGTSRMLDKAMFLACTLTTPAAPVASVQSSAVAGFSCDAPSVQWVQLTWTPDAGTDKYEVQMSTDGVTWMSQMIVETFGSITPQVVQCYGTAWDVPVFHRLLAYRKFDRLGFVSPASNAVTLASGGAVLGLSTAAAAYIYSPTDPTAVEMQWSDLNTVQIVQFHGEAFSRALRETEDRGLRLTFQAVVANLKTCTVGTLSTAQNSLNPDGFILIQALQRQEFLTVRFPGGETRNMTLELGGMTVRTSAGVYSVQITLTDVSVDGLTLTGDEFFPNPDI